MLQFVFFVKLRDRIAWWPAPGSSDYHRLGRNPFAPPWCLQNG